MHDSMEIKKDEKKEYGKYDKWEVEGWADILIKAEELKANPEKMKYIKMCMKKKLGETKKVISSLDDVRTARQDKMKEQDEEMEYES